MRNKCNIIKDILPLYAEDMASQDTRDFVDEHLKHCAGCQAELGQIKQSVDFEPDGNTLPLKKLKKKLRTKRIQTIMFTVTLAFAILVSLFAVLTSPQYFPYSDGLLTVSDNMNGSITISFDEKVTGYSCSKGIDIDTGVEVYYIDAWNTIWDGLFSKREKQNMVVDTADKKGIQVYYAQNNDAADVPIYGARVSDNEGRKTLPRMVLGAYFMFAIGAFILLFIARLLLTILFKKKSNVVIWLDRLALLPASYVLAHLLTKGINFPTYSLQRDFSMIVLVTILIYCAMLSGVSLYRARKIRKIK